MFKIYIFESITSVRIHFLFVSFGGRVCKTRPLIVPGSPSLGGALVDSEGLRSLLGLGSNPSQPCHFACVTLGKQLNLSGPQFFHL